MERLRYLNEIIDAMRDDEEVVVWQDRLVKQLFIGGSESASLEEFSTKILKRYEFYATNPIEVERESFWPESETA